MLIVDAHLDLSYNALRGREVLRQATEQSPDDQGIPSVGLPDLRRGGVRLICATVFVEPAGRKGRGYNNANEAHQTALKHLEWYDEQERAGELKLIRSVDNLRYISPADKAISSILLLEGADALRTPDDVPQFQAAGIRIVGMAWKRTRYAGGTGAPGPLTTLGIELVPALDAADMIHDVSHLAEESFWDLLRLTDRPVIASHSNCRAIVPTDRQLSDEMIRAIADRGGVIGINFFDRFLLPPADSGARQATLADVLCHVRHICDLTGTVDHVAIGTDMDGGLGRDEIPQEISTSADLPRLANALKNSGFAGDDVNKLMSGNWLRFFQCALP